jgi:hypothetical protein
MSDSHGPVLIEAAITPLRKGAPVQTAGQAVDEAVASLAAVGRPVAVGQDATAVLQGQAAVPA